MDSLRRSRWLLFGLFTVSGFAGLIYESIWSHYLKLFLGHAAYAQTLVLAIFMGGMAIGSWWVAHRSTRLQSLLIGYAMVEGLIGLLGLVFHPLSVAATQWSFESVIPALGSPILIGAFKWTLAALLILPQSVLLGTTFPLMSGAIVRRFPESSGETLALLYFTNSFGAALGVLVSGFVLIDAVGLPGTIMTAGLLNVVLALIVWGIAKFSDPEVRLDSVRTTSPADRALGARLSRLILIGAFSTGAAAFLYEVAWLRMLALVLGSSTHAFELMLSAFILGIALGGLYVRSRIQSLADPVRTLGIVMVAMAAVALATLQLYSHSFDWMAGIVTMFTATDAGYLGFNLGSHAIALVMMVPTTFFCGLTLPIMTQVLLSTGAGERAIGSVYAWNTVGSIIGIVLAVHFLMPLLGLKSIIIAGGLLHAALGIMYLTHGRRQWKRWDLATVGFAAIALIAALGLQFDPRRMASGVYRHGTASYDSNADVQYFRHGKTASISLIRAGKGVTIATNGKPDAEIAMEGDEATADEVTMVLAGAIPLAMHPRARVAANIGIGSGLTTSVLLTHDAIERVDTIEIEPFMAEAARLGFMPRVRRTFEDPRSHIHFEDAKTFFASRQQVYDVIVAEPSNPWVSGVASLFSDEFYRQLRRYLRPDGLMVQWLQIYETDVPTVQSVLKALANNFPDFAIYRTDDANVLIVAVQQGSVPAPDAAVLFSGEMGEEVARVGVSTSRDVEARFVGNRDLVAPFLSISGIPANSDYFPYVDQHAIRARVMKRTALDVSQISLHPAPIVDLALRRRPAGGALGTAPNARHYALHQMHAEATALLAALRGTLSPDAPPGLVRQAGLLNSTALQCANPAVQRAWMASAFDAAKVAIPTLSSPEIESLWVALEAAACASAIAEGDKQFLRLSRAVALRDRSGIVRQLDQLIASKYVFGGSDEYAFSLTAAAAAALGEGDAASARRYLEALENDPAARDAVPAWHRSLLTGMLLAAERERRPK